MADGSTDIVGGKLVFGPHAWHTGGMADETYLAQADLRVTRTGQVVGTSPYFGLFVGDGDRAIPPIRVELSKAFTQHGLLLSLFLR